MEMQQVSDNCFAVLNEKNRVCDANSGLINRAGGVVIDTQSDLAQPPWTTTRLPRNQGGLT
jgi:cyclase